MIQFNWQNATSFVQQSELDHLQSQVSLAHETLHKMKGPGSDYLGWLELPRKYDKDEFARIRKAAARIRRQSDVLVVIGIGGSYLGARAAIEFLTGHFHALSSKKQRKAPLVIFAGQNLSADYLSDLLAFIDDKKVSLNVISKSGTTTEPAVAFRVLKGWLEDKVGREAARERIYVTTDRARGALKGLADSEGYETFVVPDDVGGRYSVLTAVGLLPIAAAGIDIRAMMKGARLGMQALRRPTLADNPSYTYAALRNILLRKGYAIELMVNYEPSMHYLTEWWKQLFGESEGKDNRGLFPAGVDNTTDLHSMGQYVQEGRRILFETVVQIDRSRQELIVPEDPDNLDGLNFLSGTDLHEINRKAAQGTMLAHVDGGVPNLSVTLPDRTAESFGELVVFFEKACAISGYLNGVNPFDQPGVEAYKQNMFALLGKPGYEDRQAELEARLASTGPVETA